MPAKRQKKKALNRYLGYSRSLRTREDILETLDTLEFTDLCSTRNLLEQGELTEEQRTSLRRADQRLSEAFDGETLEAYQDYNPSMPIRKWWS